MIQKQLLITGCGRSGTRYTTSLLRLIGVRVKHESMGPDGLVSWCAATPAKEVPWGDPITGYKFSHTFHQVRHPLKVIPSLSSFKESSWMYICAYTPCTMDEPLILRSIKYWYYWNIKAETQSSFTYQVESLPATCEVLCNHLQIAPEQDILNKLPKLINNRNRGKLVHYYEEICDIFRIPPNQVIQDTLATKDLSNQLTKPKLTWEELKDIAPSWYPKIRQKSIQYGYS